MVRKNILDVDNFKHILTAFSDKLNEEEIEDIFGEFDFDDDGNIFTKVKEPTTSIILFNAQLNERTLRFI